MRKIVVDMQNYLFADAVATAFKSSDYDIEVIRAESPRDTVELCQIYEPFVLVMEVTGYAPWKLGERLRLRGEVKALCPNCKIALMVDANTERQTAKDIRWKNRRSWSSCQKNYRIRSSIACEKEIPLPNTVLHSIWYF